ncbi:MAG: citramalate synthase [Armatimonadetes bacterium]|nr:citramalate synthase [Armatimonadota bacterium]
MQNKGVFKLPKIAIYDTSLRDGMQSERVNFSVEDKIKIARKLDEFGMAYIEGGWPGATATDTEFFQRAKDIEFKNAKLAAFGSTCRAKYAACDDPLILKLLESGAPVITVFGKSWDLHVKDVFRIPLDQNLDMIYDTVHFLVSQGREVIYDAEHFFDGYKSDKEYALECLKRAESAGASCVSLCETNGGALPSEVYEMTAEAVKRSGIAVGIHAHNDSGMAAADSIAAVEAGATHVQGTVNGIGERCGNANLCTIIPILTLKMGLSCMPEGALRDITELSRYVDDIANLVPDDRLPFVGASAFAHKAGVHADAVAKNPRTYEHLAPEIVGNDRRILISSYAGGSNVVQNAKKFGVNLGKGDPAVKAVLDQVAHLEREGHTFEEAEASFELLLKKSLGQYRKLFDLKGFRVIVEKRGPNEEPITEVTLKIAVDGVEAFTVAEGDGPVHALDNALRLALNRFYGKELAKIKLTDFKVRVVNTHAATAAKVRTVIESRDQNQVWSTVGVSENIIEASWQALADGVEYGLLKHLDKK